MTIPIIRKRAKRPKTRTGCRTCKVCRNHVSAVSIDADVRRARADTSDATKNVRHADVVATAVGNAAGTRSS